MSALITTVVRNLIQHKTTFSIATSIRRSSSSMRRERLRGISKRREGSRCYLKHPEHSNVSSSIFDLIIRITFKIENKMNYTDEIELEDINDVLPGQVNRVSASFGSVKNEIC